MTLGKTATRRTLVAATLALLLLCAPVVAQAAFARQTTTSITPVIWNPLNQPPVFGAMASQYQVVEHQLLKVRITGIDPDGDPISFMLRQPRPAGSGLVVTNVTSPAQQEAEFQWRPAAWSAGTYTVWVTMTDGQTFVGTTFEVTVLPAAKAVGLFADTPYGNAIGDPLVIEITTPTALAAPFALLIGQHVTPGLPLSGVFGTGTLGLDPATMAVLLNGFEPRPLNPFTTPFQLSAAIPAGLQGATFSFQALAGLGADLFTSNVATVIF